MLSKVEALKFDKIKLMLPNSKFLTNSNLKRLYLGMWSTIEVADRFTFPANSTISYESVNCNDRTRLGENFDLSLMTSLRFTHFYGECKAAFP